MYRCTICHDPSKRGDPRLLHVLKRANGQIDRELPVCARCKKLLVEGVTLRDLTKRFVQEEPIPRAITMTQRVEVGKPAPQRQGLFS